jgi:two-component sensor histidine kinase
LVGSWALLADLSFSDLLLLVPVRSGASLDETERFVTVGQVRPATSQTLYRHDQVGRFFQASEQALVADALRSGEICSGEISIKPPGSEGAGESGESDSAAERIAVQAIPVCFDGRAIAILLAESSCLGLRREGELEQTYLGVFEGFATMISAGAFPFVSDEIDSEEAPRVGDGVVVLDASGRITYSSPNAVSALHRVGFHANALGRDLDDLGFQPGVLKTAYRLRVPVTVELERGLSVTILSRVVPLIRDDKIDGALVLLRDVSDLRRQARLLVSMDATIREIHHRVKNSLQTVSSLLRLQGRRMESLEARTAIDESVRRIRSIALVHEILAQEGGDEVAFGEIVRPIVEMVKDALVAPDRPISFKVVGDGPTLPATTASSLAVVLTELLQNAVEHGYPPGSSGGEVLIALEFSGSDLVVRVHDDGDGLPEDFDLATSTGLGLTIARTLAAGDLGGEITMRPVDARDAGAGTIAELKTHFPTDPAA